MASERELLKGNTPTLVLAVLRDTPLHGYAIAREIERRSGKALTFKEGTLYPTLHSLERDGMIRGEWSREDGGRERKVYTLTPAGLAALEERSRIWDAFATAIDRVLTGDLNGGTSERPERTRPTFPRDVRPEPAG